MDVYESFRSSLITSHKTLRGIGRESRQTQEKTEHLATAKLNDLLGVSVADLGYIPIACHLLTVSTSLQSKTW